MNQITRNQHFVPACYLKHFAAPPKRMGDIFAFDSRTGERQRRKPNSVCHERDFYEVETEIPTPLNYLENAFSKMEGRFAPELERVNRAQAMTIEGTQTLLEFLALQFVRTPSIRQWQKAGTDQILRADLKALAANSELLKQRCPDATKEELGDIKQTIRDLLADATATFEWNHTDHVLLALDLHRTVLENLLCYDWVLAITPDDTLAITSDDPISLRFNNERYRPPQTWHPQLGEPNTIITSALGPYLILIGRPPRGFDRQGKRRYRLTEAHVASFNTATIRRADRQVFSLQSDFKIMMGETIVKTDGSQWPRQPNDKRITNFGTLIL